MNSNLYAQKVPWSIKEISGPKSAANKKGNKD